MPQYYTSLQYQYRIQDANYKWAASINNTPLIQYYLNNLIKITDAMAAIITNETIYQALNA